MRAHYFSLITAAGLLTLAIAGQSSGQQLRSDHVRPEVLPNLPHAHSWISAGNGATDSHEAQFEAILNRGTVPLLQTRWVFAADGEVRGTPTVEGNGVYFSDAGGSVWRLNAQTGVVVWKASLPSITGISSSHARVSPALGPGVAIVGDQASSTLIALSRRTGALVWKTVLSNYQDSIITGAPVIVDGRVYVGVSSGQEGLASSVPGYVPDFRGSVVALDLKDGDILWQTYTVPLGYTGGSVWGSNLAVDPARATVYAGTGNNYSVPTQVSACQTQATSPVQLDACLAPDDHIDSLLALDMKTGAIRWSQRFTHADTWTVSCLAYSLMANPCPTPTGLDTDFGAGPNLFTIERDGRREDAVGIGQKSGAYFTMDRDTGRIIWGTQVSPDGPRGGTEWGTATDGTRIYVPSSNSAYVATNLIPADVKTEGGFWSALDPVTGRILWQTPTLAPAPVPSSPPSIQPPLGATAEAEGSVSVANGVMYGEDAAGNFVALDTDTGRVLWSYRSGGAGIAAPAVAGGSLYWASGYGSIGATNNQVYAFSVNGH